MKLRMHFVLILSENTHVRIQIYQEFYHCNNYIANERRHALS